jgi:hypothetical protein
VGEATPPPVAVEESVPVAGAEDSALEGVPAGDQPADGSVPAAPAESKQPTGKQEDSKQSGSKQPTGKQEDSKQSSGKQSESKQSESKQSSDKQSESQQSEPSKGTITTPPVGSAPPVVPVVVAPTKHDGGDKDKSKSRDSQRD